LLRRRAGDAARYGASAVLERTAEVLRLLVRRRLELRLRFAFRFVAMFFRLSPGRPSVNFAPAGLCTRTFVNLTLRFARAFVLIKISPFSEIYCGV
jgi:hypothetical protein